MGETCKWDYIWYTHLWNNTHLHCWSEVWQCVLCVFIPAKFGAVTKNPKLKAQVLEQPGSHLSEGKFVAMVIVSPLVYSTERGQWCTHTNCPCLNDMWILTVVSEAMNLAKMIWMCAGEMNIAIVIICVYVCVCVCVLWCMGTLHPAQGLMLNMRNPETGKRDC